MPSGCCLSGLASASSAEGCGAASFGASAVLGSCASCLGPGGCPVLSANLSAAAEAASGSCHVLPMKQEERLLLLPECSLWWHYPPELLCQHLLQGDLRQSWGRQAVSVMAWTSVEQLCHLSWIAAVLICFSKTRSPTHTGSTVRHLPLLYTLVPRQIGHVI